LTANEAEAQDYLDTLDALLKALDTAGPQGEPDYARHRQTLLQWIAEAGRGNFPSRMAANPATGLPRRPA
jgi:hypothetical protein